MNFCLTRTSFLIFIFHLLLFLSFTAAKVKVQSDSIETDKDIMIVEMQKILDDEFRLLYPLSIDTLYGGYFSDINYKWELDGRQNKMIVTQAYHIWSASNAFIFNNNNELVKIAAHGFSFLKDKMWDKDFGGFYNLVNREGKPLKENGETIKTAYSNAFAVYGLAAYYKASGNASALKLAEETFNWLK